MNSDENDSPSNSSVPASTGRRIRVRSLKRPSISQEASLPSIPSDDNEWVSPFTLPPLPAFKKNRSHLDRSPDDRIHNRSGSSAYYAAAWGSPYATPSPSQSPAPKATRNKSFDLESSPLASRKLGLDPSSSRHARQHSLPTQESIRPADLQSSPSPISSQDKSQRRNWLSESEDSESELEKEGKTPTQRKLSNQESARSSVRTHHLQESVATITLETFNGSSGIDETSNSHSKSTSMAEPQPPSPSPMGEKPLPNLPTEQPVDNTETRPRPTIPPPVQQPFQRTRKKVPWKTKSCIIAMPLTDREQAGLPPVLTPEEREERLHRWVQLGYPVHGFSVGDWYSSTGSTRGASRPAFPDPVDMDIERKTTQPGVHIPNQSEWDAWVNYLKEEKLRALGVTPSTSEAPASTQSPFSSTMSRVSSAYPSNMAPSPPVPSMSAASARAHMSPSPFSPIISNPGSVGYPTLSQRGTPGLPNGRPMHGYTQSVAFPGMGQRMGSPFVGFDGSMSQNGVYGANIRSPDGQFNGRKPWSPGHVQNIQSMANIVSPVNPSPQDFARQFTSSPQIQAIQRQQEALARQQEQVRAKMAHIRQMSMLPFRTMSQEQVQQLHQIPLTPKAASPEREPPEIMQPTPRSHRHNLSAALEKGVTDQVAASSKVLSNAVHSETPEDSAEKKTEQELEEGEIAEDAEQEELPILHRPETIKEADEEDAEIETNPSIAGTPLLLDDKNPFSNFKPLPPPEPSNKHPGLGHSAQPSLSKLNVQAKEFSPSKVAFSPTAGVFNFDGNAFASHQSSPGKSATSGPRFGHKHNPSSLGLNVAAPVFTPSFAMKPNADSQPSAPGSARISRDFQTEQHSGPGTPAKAAFDPQSSFFSANADSIPEEPTPAKPAFDPEVSTFSFGGEDIQQGTPAKPEFNPRSSTFSFTGNDKSMQGTPARSEFNPNASTFSTFSFGSTSFNVEAPEFKPSGTTLESLDFTPEKPNIYTGSMFGDVVINPSNKPERRSKAVPIVKPQPREECAPPEDKDKEEFGNDGRAIAPSERHKRTKTMGLPNEEIVFANSAPFASLADDSKPQEVEIEKLEKVDEESEHIAEDAVKEQQPDESVSKVEELPTETAAEIVKGTEAESDEVQAVPEVEATTESDNIVADVQSSTQEPQEPDTSLQEPTATANLVEATDKIEEEEPETAASEPVAPTTETQEEPSPIIKDHTQAEQHSQTTVHEEPQSEENASHTDPVKTVSPVGSEQTSQPQPSLSAEAPAFEPGNMHADSSASGLSALAQPFEFKPTVKDFVPEPKPVTPVEQAPPKIKKGGLMASRFAASPEPDPPKMVERNTSPPQQLFGEREIELPSEPVSDIKAESPGSVAGVAEDIESHKEPDLIRDEAARTLEKYREHDSAEGSVVSQAGDLSYEEINAVMKQFEEHPDLGIIREDTPVKSTPLIDMRFPQQFRSDAPSPSPNRRLDRPFDPHSERHYDGLGFHMSGVHQLNYGGSGEVSDWNADLDLSPGQQDKLEARAKFFDDHVNDIVDNVLENRLAPLERALLNIQNTMQEVTGRSRNSRHSMSTGNKDSDADDEDEYDAYEGYQHYRSKSPSKRNRQQERIKAAVMEAMTVAQSTLPAPQVDMSFIHSALTEMRELAHKAAEPPAPVVDMSGIQEALQELRNAAQKEVKAPEIDTTELTRTVAEMKALAQQRAAEPQLDIQALRVALDEIRQAASEKPTIPEVDLTAVLQGLADLKTGAEERLREPPADLKSVLEDVITTHPRLRGSRIEAEHEDTQKLKTSIKDLEAMLKVAEKRADGEAALRREAEEENDTLHRHLKEAKDQATFHKEASQEAQKSLESFLQEKNDYMALNTELRDLRAKNEALERTLNEYRDFKSQVTEELEKERGRTDSLARALQDARHLHRDQLETRDMLREQLSRIQERVTTVTEDFRHDEAEWRKREHDLLSKNQLLQAALDHETNRRARTELEAERLNKEHRESLVFRSKHETAQEEVSRLANIIVGLQKENKQHQDSAYAAQREITFLKERQEEIIASSTSRLQDELDASRSMLLTLQADSDARIARLQGQLDTAAVELQEAKIKHESNMQKMFENHNAAIRDAGEKHAAELERRLAFHEEKLIDLRNQHSRDIKNAEEDRKAVEHRYEEKLALSDDKVKHLESRIEDLKHSLEITQKAARAAAESAISKGANLPTPASSVVASPPHRPSISSASVPLQRGSDLPEKISPQALRETIMVLQDQLQNREQKIDKLESELAAIDKDAPAKVKERDTEIVMLRELLDVRLDDLQELIATLEKPEYNKQAVRDAAIRLKTQIKMDQQLRERAISSASLANNLPASITAGISNLTQSPRAMVAAAAWGNWRKIRDSGVGNAVSDFASNIGSQTPSRSSSVSSNPLAGIMSPPASKSGESSRPSTARPLAAAAAARKAGGPPSGGVRPLRSFSSQPRTLAGARPLARRDTNESRPGSSDLAIEPSTTKIETPSTPTRAHVESDFGDDIDEDASPLDGKDRGFESEEIEEPPKPLKVVSPRTSRSSVSKPPVSPRTTRSSRHSSGKPVSPRALRASAGIAQNDVVDVFEED